MSYRYMTSIGKIYLSRKLPFKDALRMKDSKVEMHGFSISCLVMSGKVDS